MPPYEQLRLSPVIMAKSVCFQKYVGQEIGSTIKKFDVIKKIESARLRMTEQSRKEFCQHTEQRCREAYSKQAKWFMDCIKARPDDGQNRLYSIILRWLSEYLLDPAKFKRNYHKTEV